MFGFSCINNAMILCNGSGALALHTIAIVYYQFRRVGVHVIDQKAHGKSHLHISMFLTQYCYWLIMDHGCKPPFDWSLYTMLTEG